MRTGNTPNFSHGHGDGGIKRAIGQTSGPTAPDETKPADATETKDTKKSDDSAEVQIGKDTLNKGDQQQETTTSTESTNQKATNDLVGRTSKILNDTWANKGAQSLTEAEKAATSNGTNPAFDVRDYISEVRQRELKAPDGTIGLSETHRGEILNDFPRLQETLSTTDRLIGGHQSPDAAGFTGNDNQLALAGGLPGTGQFGQGQIQGQNIAIGNLNNGVQVNQPVVGNNLPIDINPTESFQRNSAIETERPQSDLFSDKDADDQAKTL